MDGTSSLASRLIWLDAFYQDLLDPERPAGLSVTKASVRVALIPLLWFLRWRSVRQQCGTTASGSAWPHLALGVAVEASETALEAVERYSLVRAARASQARSDDERPEARALRTLKALGWAGAIRIVGWMVRAHLRMAVVRAVTQEASLTVQWGPVMMGSLFRGAGTVYPLGPAAPARPMVLAVGGHLFHFAEISAARAPGAALASVEAAVDARGWRVLLAGLPESLARALLFHVTANL